MGCTACVQSNNLKPLEDMKEFTLDSDLKDQFSGVDLSPERWAKPYITLEKRLLLKEKDWKSLIKTEINYPKQKLLYGTGLILIKVKEIWVSGLSMNSEANLEFKDEMNGIIKKASEMLNKGMKMMFCSQMEKIIKELFCGLFECFHFLCVLLDLLTNDIGAKWWTTDDKYHLQAIKEKIIRLSFPESSPNTSTDQQKDSNHEFTSIDLETSNFKKPLDHLQSPSSKKKCKEDSIKENSNDEEEKLEELELKNLKRIPKIATVYPIQINEEKNDKNYFIQSYNTEKEICVFQNIQENGCVTFGIDDDSRGNKLNESQKKTIRFPDNVRNEANGIEKLAHSQESFHKECIQLMKPY